MLALPSPRFTRAFAFTAGIQAAAFGMLTSLSALYFTRFIGLSVAKLGFGLTAVAIAGLLIGPLIGHLADRVGARGLLILLLGLQGAIVAAYLLIDSYLLFLLIIGAYQTCERAASAVRGGLIARAVPANEQIMVRAYVRTIVNVGFAVGALLAGIALQLDSRAAFRAFIVLAAVGYWCAALSLLQVPKVAAIPRAKAARFYAALKDKPFLLFNLLNMILAFHFAILEIGIPLWVINHTVAPKWMVTAMFLINTALVIGLQVKISLYLDRGGQHGKAFLHTGLLLAGGCLFFYLSATSHLGLAIAALLGAALLLALGEMHQTTLAWTLAYQMAPENAQGQYQGLFATTSSTGVALGASVVTSLVLGYGRPGWIILGMIFLATALALTLLLAYLRR